MKTQKEILEDFFKLCEGRVSLSLKDGTHYEGYLSEILNDKIFTFFLGGPLAPDKPIEIEINAVDLNSLCYADFSEYKWKTAKLIGDKWEIE